MDFEATENDTLQLPQFTAYFDLFLNSQLTLHFYSKDQLNTNKALYVNKANLYVGHENDQ